MCNKNVLQKQEVQPLFSITIISLIDLFTCWIIMKMQHLKDRRIATNSRAVKLFDVTLLLPLTVCFLFSLFQQKVPDKSDLTPPASH